MCALLFLPSFTDKDNLSCWRRSGPSLLNMMLSYLWSVRSGGAPLVYGYREWERPTWGGGQTQGLPPRRPRFKSHVSPNVAFFWIYVAYVHKLWNMIPTWVTSVVWSSPKFLSKLYLCLNVTKLRLFDVNNNPTVGQCETCVSKLYFKSWTRRCIFILANLQRRTVRSLLKVTKQAAVFDELQMRRCSHGTLGFVDRDRGVL